MNRYCTVADAGDWPHVLALLASLRKHDRDFQLHVLRRDEARVLPPGHPDAGRVKQETVDRLVAAHPGLAAARADRTSDEFLLMCRPWLLHHLLPGLPEGGRLIFVAPRLFFFDSPQPLFEEIEGAPAAVVAPDPAAEDSRHGAGWVAVRNTTAGRAITAQWAERSRASFPVCGPAGRPPARRHPAGWPELLPGVAVVSLPAAAGRGIIFYDFSALRHLGHGLYDAGHEPGIVAPLRESVYLPYLRQLAGDTPKPDLVPPADLADPRCGPVLGKLAEESCRLASELESARRALHASRDSQRQMAAEMRARAAESERYLHQVEQDRDQQRQSFFATRKRLEEIHQDLLHNIDYLKKLHAEADAQKQAAVDREAYVASLKLQLAGRTEGKSGGPDLARLHHALLPHGREIRRLLVARHHPALLPLILSLSAQGVSIEVLGSPDGLSGDTRGSVHFLGGNLWDWLGGLTSLFDEVAYLRANPDVAAALAGGAVRSGWDHYQRFGQFEGRPTGVPEFRAGLADFDAVAFDSADAGDIVPCLIGRLQPHHRLYVSSSFNPATVWLPDDSPRTIVLDDLLCCLRPPPAWIGPRLPSAVPAPHRPKPAAAEVFPNTPAQPAVWPKITVIIVNRDRAAACAASLRSVLDQRYPMLECLVVDMASTDGSAGMIGENADRLAWWTSEPAAGLGDALNKGFAKSTGVLLGWLRAGDRLAPGSLYTVAQQHLLHAPDLIGGRCAPAGGGPIQRSVLALGRLQPLPRESLLDLGGFWSQDTFFRQPAVFVSRAALDRTGGPAVPPDLQHAPDYCLWLRLAHGAARVLPIPEVLALQDAPPARPAILDELAAIRRDHLTPPSA